MQQGLAALRVTGTELGRTGHLLMLAASHAKAGRVEEGLTLLAEALAMVDKNGERHYETELYRLKGELTLQKAFKVQGSKFQVTDPQLPLSDPQVEAAGCFLNAIEVVRKQQAKSLELCATMSLARLWQQQGKKGEARQMLAEIYGWFTEGFDTKDLQEAQALLEE
jgi:predicted ATPase